MRETAHTMIPNLSFFFWQTAMTELCIQYPITYVLLQKELGIMALSFRLFSGKILRERKPSKLNDNCVRHVYVTTCTLHVVKQANI